MKRIICIVLFVAIFCSFFVVASADDRFYAVDGNWEVYAYNSFVDVFVDDRPFVVLQGKNGFIQFNNESFVVPSGVSTIYGRFVLDTPLADSVIKNGFKNIAVCGITTQFIVNGSYLYFSATGNFKNFSEGMHGLSLNFSETLPGNCKIQLDYLYVRSSSFVSVPFTSLGTSYSTLDSIPSSRVGTSGTVDFSGVNSFGDNISKGNVFSVTLDFALDRALLSLDNGSFLFSSQIMNGVVVDSVLTSSYGPLPHNLQTDCDFLDSTTNVHSDWSFFKTGTHEETTAWNNSYTGPYPYGNYVQYQGAMTQHSLVLEEFYQKVIESYSYDVQHSVVSSSGIIVSADLSSLDPNADSISLTLYLLTNGTNFSPVVSPFQAGVYLNSADLDPSGDTTWIGSVRSFFENGVSAIVSSITTGWKNIVDAINPDVDNSAADTITSQAGQVHDFESSQQEVFNQYSPQLTQGLNVSGYSGAFLFVGNFLSDIYGVLGPYQIVITLPICIGIVMFILGRVNGSMIPSKPQKYDKVLILKKKE